jgi:4-hydroxybenzoate polyprenyltransferase
MQRSLLLARVLHVIAVVCFAAIVLFQLFPVGALYTAGLGVMIGLLIYEHSLIRSLNSGQIDYQRIDKAFFTMNVLVSMSFFFFTLLDRVFTT